MVHIKADNIFSSALSDKIVKVRNIKSYAAHNFIPFPVKQTLAPAKLRIYLGKAAAFAERSGGSRPKAV